ncbi:MBL fold metallo-hydrolase [Corynebacterium sp. HMSC04H06]|uniref:MBL fold metallo-hydrolase n=1 Tax=Corynebacterium sp. HMSC04H06 TaxID=1581050 RepID=UPI0008A49222|nr:MBL fold metallo-hydrolase [Corynebacterium sp. HMSC04H06]OFS23323.1 Zn-dependent hydrolase [Corynebacterium sp. HMSC04H06]
MRIENLVTSGKFCLDGGCWDVDNNVYVLSVGDAVVVVDPSHDLDAIADQVGDRAVCAILLTHAHNDHCELAPRAARRFNAPVYLHPDDDVLWQESNGNAPYLHLYDGQRFLLEGEEIRVLHTPGHSPGCVVLYLPGEETLLSGDTLFSGGPGATGRKYSDFDVIVESLRDVVFFLPAETRVLPGHGDATTVGAEADRIDEYVRRGY